MILVSHTPVFWPRRAPQPRVVTHRFTLQMREGATEVIDEPDEGVSVRCNRGRLWITHDGDPKDVVLEAGQGYTSQKSGRMTLHAVALSEVEMVFRR
ncbi:MAG: DUF2917 domain-containing protein [Burkholderiales bacterium]|nr:DUF2917 domain-containing protein [Burkholderiales bacterium]